MLAPRHLIHRVLCCFVLLAGSSHAQTPIGHLTPVSYVPVIDWPSSCPSETFGTAEMLGWNLAPYDNLVVAGPTEETKPKEIQAVLPRVCTHDSCPLPSLAERRIVASKPIHDREQSTQEEFERVLDQICGKATDLMDLLTTYSNKVNTDSSRVANTTVTLETVEAPKANAELNVIEPPRYSDQDYARLYATIGTTKERVSTWVESGLAQLAEWSEEALVEDSIFSEECNPLWLDSLVADLAREEPIDARNEPIAQLDDAMTDPSNATDASETLADSKIQIKPKRDLVGSAPIVATIRESYLPYDLTAMDAPIWQTLPSRYQPFCLHDDFRPLGVVAVPSSENQPQDSPVAVSDEPNERQGDDGQPEVSTVAEVDWSELEELVSWAADQWKSIQALTSGFDSDGPIFRQAAETDETLLK